MTQTDDEEPSKKPNGASRRTNGEADAEVVAGGVCQPSRRPSDASKPRREDAPTEENDAPSYDQSGVLERLERIKRGEHLGDPASLGEAASSVVEQTEEETSRIETRLKWEGPGSIVYEPSLFQTSPEVYSLEAKRENRGVIPWGFWGGLFFVGLAVVLLASAQNIYSMWDTFLAILGLTAGALMYRYGRKSTLDDVQLCEIDGRRRIIHIPQGAQSGLVETHISFDEVTEVVFGMTKLPVDDRTEEVRVEAFALLVRTDDDSLIPIIEGSPYKEEVHELGKFVSSMTETKMTYVGRGIRP